MNTVKIGDKFEDKCFKLIEEAIQKGDLGIDRASAKVFRKKGYYSRDREKNIIFDLSIELWPDGADRFTIVFLIECKGYSSKNVPVDDVEEFYTKINEVAGANLKGVMISDTSFQEGGRTFAKNKGMMMIEVNPDDKYSIILHRTSNQKEAVPDEIEDLFSKFLVRTLSFGKVSGLKRLSAHKIEEKAEEILKKYNGLRRPLSFNTFVKFLEERYKLEFNFSNNLETVSGKKIEGYFDRKNNRILIDKSIPDTPKFPFLLAHEIGHFFLHQDLKINQDVYNSFEDSNFDPFSNRHKFTNSKHWIEWQANKFSIGLLLPKKMFKCELIRFRTNIGIPNPTRIYLDKQPINQIDFSKTITHLSKYFGTSKTSVKYRLEEMGLIEYSENVNNIQGLIREALAILE